MSDIAAMISHASRDADAARQLCNALEARGQRCWIAPRDLSPGEEWTDGIVRGIEIADSLVLVVSEQINKSPHILSEITQAVHHGKPIYPVVIDDVRLTRSLDYYLRPRHWLFARSGTLEQAAQSLADATRGLRGWHESAVAPSLGRRLRYGSLRSIIATFTGTLAALLLVAGVAWLLHERDLAARSAAENASYLSIGWVAPWSAVRQAEGGEGDSRGWVISGSVFLAGQNPGFAQVALALAADAPGSAERQSDMTLQLDRLQVGHSQAFRVRVPTLVPTMVFCLTRPHPVLETPHRVVQRFHVVPAPLKEGEERVEFVAASDPTVVSSPTQPCTA